MRMRMRMNMICALLIFVSSYKCSSLSCRQNHRPPLYQHEWAPQNVFAQTRRKVLSKMIPFWALIIAGKCPCPSLGSFWNQDHGLITPGSDSDHTNVCHIKGFWCFCWLEFSHLICHANSKDLDRYQKTAEVSAELWFDWRNCSFNRFEHQKDWNNREKLKKVYYSRRSAAKPACTEQNTSKQDWLAKKSQTAFCPVLHLGVSSNLLGNY